MAESKFNTALIACPECDLLHRLPSQRGDRERSLRGSRCVRCSAVLFRPKPRGVERSLALALAGCILFIAANVQPFLQLHIGPQVSQTTLLGSIQQLVQDDMWLFAGVVLFTCFIAPLCQLLGLIYVLVPLYRRREALHSRTVYRLIRWLKPWAMVEILVLGLLISLVKLGEMAELNIGIGLWALAALVPLLAAIEANLDPRAVWLGNRR